MGVVLTTVEPDVLWRAGRMDTGVVLSSVEPGWLGQVWEVDVNVVLTNEEPSTSCVLQLDA